MHGWLDKKSSKPGYFSSYKRVYVTVEDQKLRYYKDKNTTSQKGVIDFTMIKAKLDPIDDKKFKISVKVKGGQTKEFIFKALTTGLIGTWMSYINLNLANPRIEFFSASTSK